MRIEIPQCNIVIEEAQAGANLLTTLVSHGLAVARSCGGDGVCATCVVRIQGEDLPQRSALEMKLIQRQRKDPEQRVACLIKVPESSKTWVIRADYW